jgi:integrase
MYQGRRYHKSFNGLTKGEVENLEIIHKSELIKNGYDITLKKTVFLKELIGDLKEYYKGHATRPDEFDYVLNNFYMLVGNKNVEDIIPADIEKYINSRLSKVKNSSINREVDVIRRLFSLAIENKKLKESPCVAIKKLRIDNPPERYLTKEEENKLLAACNPIMKAIILTALHTGGRQNEILSLKWSDVFFDENYLVLLNTKNNRPRRLPLTKTLKKALKNLPKLSEYVFTSPVTNSRYTEVKTTFGRAVKRAGIPHITFHKIRHTTASRLDEEGVDVVTIQKILDHAELRTTQGYIHTTDKSMANAFKMLNNY